MNERLNDEYDNVSLGHAAGVVPGQTVRVPVGGDGWAMNAKELGDQPAFPAQEMSQAGGPAHAMVYGFTKREYFAAMALQGILSTKPSSFKDTLTTTAVEYADELLKVLAKECQ